MIINKFGRLGLPRRLRSLLPAPWGTAVRCVGHLTLPGALTTQPIHLHGVGVSPAWSVPASFFVIFDFWQVALHFMYLEMLQKNPKEADSSRVFGLCCVVLLFCFF